jgi:limonene 1,2-monooxygenase
VSLPYHNPFMLTDRMIQLDHMTRGRAMFGVGPGALAGDAFRIGIHPADQRRRMDESLDVIMALLRGETVTHQTDWFTLQEARLQMLSYSRPHIEMAVACSRSPVGALAAGKHGIGMLSIGGTSDAAMEQHRANWGVAEQTAAEHGKTVHRDKWRVVSLLHIAPTREQALRNVEFGLPAWAKYLREIATFPIVPPEITDPIRYLIDNKMAVIGTPDDAIAYIEHLQKGAGGFGAFMELAHNWADWGATRQSYELMARHVLPHFQGSNDLREYSYNYSFGNREKLVGAASEAVEAAKRAYAEKQAGKQAAE